LKWKQTKPDVKITKAEAPSLYTWISRQKTFMRKSFQGEPSDVELTAVQIQKLQQVGITVTGPSSFEQNFEQRMQELENFVRPSSSVLSPLLLQTRAQLTFSSYRSNRKRNLDMSTLAVKSRSTRACTTF
jgi:hypothetical protein